MIKIVLNYFFIKKINSFVQLLCTYTNKKHQKTKDAKPNEMINFLYEKCILKRFFSVFF